MKSKVILLAVVLILAVLAGLYRSRQRDPLVQKTLDSLHVTRDSHLARVDTLIRAADVFERVADTLLIRARGLRPAARPAAVVPVPVADSAGHYRGLWQTEVLRADSLETAVQTYEQVDSARTAEVKVLRLALTEVQARSAALEAVNMRLATLTQGPKRCTIALGVPCPTRVAAASGAALLTVVLLGTKR